MKHFIIAILLSFPIGLAAQEICDNGIDDDGDGLVDLNDTADCRCLGIHDGVTSLIPNPSFEDTLCCPLELTQLHCADTWIQASTPTTDYYNTCGITRLSESLPIPAPPLPLPGGGAGYAGFYDYTWWQEMLGACLNTPMKADSSYRISMFIAPGLGERSDPLVVSLYGTPACSDLPWPGHGCPIGFGSWVLLASDTLQFRDHSWQQAFMEFRPQTDIHALAIGGACGPAGDSALTNYYYIDELRVAAAAAFDYNSRITETGTWCSNDLKLRAGIDTPGGSWQWYQNGIALVGETADSLLLLPYGVDAVYTAVYTLNGTCVSVDHQVDTTTPGNGLALDLEILTPDTLVCEGAVVAVRARGTAGAEYRWYPTLGVSDTTALNPDILAPGDTSILYTLESRFPGCRDSTTRHLLIQVDQPSGVSFEADRQHVCVGQTVHFYPNLDHAVERVSWAFDDHHRLEAYPQAVFQHAFERPGLHTVTLSGRLRACPDTSYSGSILVYALPEIDLGGDSSICPGGSPLYLQNLRNASLTPYHQVWSTGDTTAILKVVHPGIYTLQVTTEPIGCTATESIEIKKGCYLDIPNSFTPNGDGHNDYFFPRALSAAGLLRFQLQIFNRWGEIVFETTNPNGRGWDGQINGKVQGMGVYYYRIEADFSNGYTESREGNVTLIR